MAETMQGPVDRFSISGHNFNGGLDDGYRVCSICGFHENHPKLPRYCGSAGREIASLRAQLEAAREDSERLDWVTAHDVEIWQHDRGWTALAGDQPNPDGYTAETLRAAIDAARQSEAGEGKE